MDAVKKVDGLGEVNAGVRSQKINTGIREHLPEGITSRDCDDHVSNGLESYHQDLPGRTIRNPWRRGAQLYHVGRPLVKRGESICPPEVLASEMPANSPENRQEQRQQENEVFV